MSSTRDSGPRLLLSRRTETFSSAVAGLGSSWIILIMIHTASLMIFPFSQCDSRSLFGVSPGACCKF
ncbi:Hypothetical protein NTJ_02925 [Nesidiocoris tenuis]|uniref:Uncharacterized protein n=1 Tax=Nesidiocoris tenuis TaxID=355587 RepID=A0ABN7ACU4_9HEMI|nr:Hypothetical protein NTJ_02925 [Nesidiocoris tenuis]